MADVTLDYYAILNVSPDATSNDITRAYRKQALKVHPDKNPDNPDAEQQFRLLTTAYEFLLDPKARAAYDQVIKAKLEKIKRDDALDSKRRVMKEDLNTREQYAKRQKTDELEAKLKLQKELERLKQENQARLAEEAAALQRAQSKAAQSSTVSESERSRLATVVVQWPESMSMDEEQLSVALLPAIGLTGGHIIRMSLDKKLHSASVILDSPLSASAFIRRVKQENSLIAPLMIVSHFSQSTFTATPLLQERNVQRLMAEALAAAESDDVSWKQFEERVLLNFLQS